MSGKHTTGLVIYGNLWDEKRENWLVDEEAAAVVQSIFHLAMEGYGSYEISQILTEKKIEIPSVHLARYAEGVNQTKTFKALADGARPLLCRSLKSVNISAILVASRPANTSKTRKATMLKQANG
jgi:hypothetical protein